MIKMVVDAGNIRPGDVIKIGRLRYNVSGVFVDFSRKEARISGSVGAGYTGQPNMQLYVRMTTPLQIRRETR